MPKVWCADRVFFSDYQYLCWVRLKQMLPFTHSLYCWLFCACNAYWIIDSTLIWKLTWLPACHGVVKTPQQCLYLSVHSSSSTCWLAWQAPLCRSLGCHWEVVSWELPSARWYSACYCSFPLTLPHKRGKASWTCFATDFFWPFTLLNFTRCVYRLGCKVTYYILLYYCCLFCQLVHVHAIVQHPQPRWAFQTHCFGKAFSGTHALTLVLHWSFPLFLVFGIPWERGRFS